MTGQGTGRSRSRCLFVFCPPGVLCSRARALMRPTTHARILSIRDECFADDLAVPPAASSWSEEDVFSFFLSGGLRLPGDAALPSGSHHPSAAMEAEKALARILSSGPDQHRLVLGLDGVDVLTEGQITKAFRQQSLLIHPDKNDDVDAAEAFRRVQSACEALRAQLHSSKPCQLKAKPTGDSGAADVAFEDFDMDGDLWDYYYWRRQREAALATTG